uniref:Noc7 n=1 Tax=Nocardia sp. ATCC 202099 TaxID=930400 RepID=E5DUJ3_9NOCA|nr:Noc7 [Nocardia sp. ATCC 202099]
MFRRWHGGPGADGRNTPVTTRPRITASALTLAGALVLSACGSDDNRDTIKWTLDKGNVPVPTATIPIDCGGTRALTGEGSTAQKGAMDVFVAAYTQQCPGQQMAYTASGSGAGVKQFLAGLVDIGGSDSALKPERGEVTDAAARCGGNPAWNLPLVFGPVAVVYQIRYL